MRKFQVQMVLPWGAGQSEFDWFGLALKEVKETGQENVCASLAVSQVGVPHAQPNFPEEYTCVKIWVYPE